MCAQFEIEKTLFLEKLKKIHIPIEEFELKTRFLPYSQAPVIIIEENKIVVRQMNFSIIPKWSKDKKPKFATHNARIETITEKMTWKNLFGKKHCLVALTTFIEPIYHGHYAGNMVKFILEECFLVPGLFETSNDGNGLFGSFAIITSEPSLFLKEAGHDRSPIFLEQKNIINWLDTNKNDQKYYFKLLEKKIEPKIHIEIDRKMKPGWEKRK